MSLLTTGIIQNGLLGPEGLTRYTAYTNHVQSFVYPSVGGTFVIPSLCSALAIDLIGGGGAGGYHTASGVDAGYGGGGGGGYALKVVQNPQLSAGTSWTVTVGKGAFYTGGVTLTQSTASEVGPGICKANGGATGSGTGQGGGTGGSGAIGDILYTGGAGGNGAGNSLTTIKTGGGGGAASSMGGGGAGGTDGGAGVGGAGGIGAAVNGGTGADGAAYTIQPRYFEADGISAGSAQWGAAGSGGYRSSGGNDTTGGNGSNGGVWIYWTTYVEYYA